MLRTLVLALLLANVSYFVWAQGWLMALELGPLQQAEPQRLQQQIHPEAIRLLTPPSSSTSPPVAPASAPASGVAAPASEPVASAAPAGECLQAGLFSEEQVNALRPRLASTLPAGSWAFSPAVEPSRWIVYMGPYPTEDLLAKKRSELRARGVKFEPVQNPRLYPGLSLGHFDTKQDADRELARDVERGVRTARVVQERAEVRGHRLTLPAADEALKTQLNTLRPRLAGKALVRCA